MKISYTIVNKSPEFVGEERFAGEIDTECHVDDINKAYVELTEIVDNAFSAVQTARLHKMWKEREERPSHQEESA